MKLCPTTQPGSPGVSASFSHFSGTVFGLIGCHYAKPAYSLFRSQNAFFRKPWMAIPFFGSVFFFTFHCAAQFPLRVFPKLFDRKNYKEKYSNNF